MYVYELETYPIIVNRAMLPQYQDVTLPMAYLPVITSLSKQKSR
jgi:hypothetical protein